MSRQIDVSTVIASIASAFLPLRCAVEDHDHGNCIRFRVFGPDDEPLLRMEDVPTRRLRDLGGLSTIIGEARRRIEARGFKLEVWKPPEPKDES